VQQVTQSFNLPLLYNFVETGKSPLIPTQELERLGFKLVIFPVSALLFVCNVVANLMRELKQQGTTAHLMNNIVRLEECFETVGLSEMLAQDVRYATMPQELS
jgi:2-methylisocitrate lyase-like PEP mutase family enzyme